MGDMPQLMIIKLAQCITQWPAYVTYLVHLIRRGQSLLIDAGL